MTCSPDYASHNRGALKPNNCAMIECLIEMLILRRNTLPTSSWTQSTSVRSRRAFRLSEKMCLSSWMGLFALTSQISTFASLVAPNSTSKPSSDLSPHTSYPFMTKLDKSRISRNLSALSCTQIDGCEDGGMRTKISLLDITSKCG